MKTFLTASLLFLLLLLPRVARAQGSMFVTGHGADDAHMGFPAADYPFVERFFTAGLDFLLFGQKAAPDQIGKRAAVRIAYIDPLNPKNISGRHEFDFTSGYPNPILFNILASDWKRALVPGAFDIVIVGWIRYGGGPEDAPQMSALMNARGDFEKFLNQGGKLFAILQGFESSYLPKFATVAGIQANFPPHLYVTPAGEALGMDTSMFDGSMDLYQRFELDTAVFKVFERSALLENGRSDLPVTFGFYGHIKDSVFVPDPVNVVQRIRSTVPSGAFTDSVCVEFSTPTDGAVLHYGLNGAPPDLSPLTLANPGKLCFRQTTTIRLIAKQAGWKDSPDTVFTYTRKLPPGPSSLSLFAGGRELAVVTADDTLLTARLTRPDGLTCSGCSIQVTPSGGTDAERIALTLLGSVFMGGFRRVESTGIIAGDGTLQHGSADSIILVWVNPADPAERLRRSYPYVPRPPRIPQTPALSLFYRGRELAAIEASQSDLEIHLSLDSSENCAACRVRIFPSPGLDSETVLVAGGASLLTGSFRRELALASVPGDGVLQHGRGDSIVLLYIDPVDPNRWARRSYPFLPERDTLDVIPQNTVAHTGSGGSPGEGRAWILSDAPGLVPRIAKGLGTGYLIANEPVNARNPDSLRLVGLVIEASHGFTFRLAAFSNLGEAVNQLAFTIPESEFIKLAPIAGKSTRSLRVLWNGRASNGMRAGNGVYVMKATLSLLPTLAEAGPLQSLTWVRRIGILRSEP